MKVGIAAVAHYSLGHAGIARALSRKLEGQYQVSVYSDQQQLLTSTGFLPSAQNLMALWQDMREAIDPMILIVDTIPFRREELVYNLLKTKSCRRHRLIAGHTGWFPYFNKDHVEKWNELLSILFD